MSRIHAARAGPFWRGSAPLGIVVALAVVATTACSGTFAAVRGRDAATARARYADLPVRLCLAPGAHALADSARGDAAMLLALRNGVPSDRYSAPFTLSLIDGAQRRPLLAFGMQPDHVEGGRAQPQRFRIPLRDVPLRPDPRGRLCFELDAELGAELDAAPEASAPDPGATLEISLRWSTPATAP